MMFGVRSDDCIKMHRTTSWTWPAAEVLPLWSCWNRSLACGPSSCLAMQSLQTALLPGRLKACAASLADGAERRTDFLARRLLAR